MLKKYITPLVLVLLFSCGEEKTDKNLHISGYIKGLKKGTLYIQHIKEGALVALDTIKIDGDSHFTSDLTIKTPEMFYLFLDRGVSNSIDNNLPFFVEPGHLNIESSLEFFTADAKISGSKNQELYDEYKTVVSRYVDRNLELVKQRFDALKAKEETSVIKIEEEQKRIVMQKYLYTTNFAVNHGAYDVAPYVALAEIPDINLKYLDTIEKSLTPKVAHALYGTKLHELIAERKKTEKK
ncbi:DUF4369 domain-containing protein [Flavobacterium aciduliphilum]|uniref:Uncharacterized protein DUF4369 n=1 Tax=Flavobacterium aciduliphilum TaxID=1101402 RepID=A0A328YQ04_9FLAO|nr:DUF4369 domain-containing protein [Flavobacterium aciduliphilum]RAR75700.1 uncharacterized protein DUF4369 [Flavobacterium aciduliphilum]